MMMGINKPWRDYLVFAIDGRDIFRYVNILANLGDTAIRDEDVGVSENNNIVLLIMLKDNAVLEK
jgi:hypothetical protein